jgi:hypothetical protein
MVRSFCDEGKTEPAEGIEIPRAGSLIDVVPSELRGRTECRPPARDA